MAIQVAFDDLYEAKRVGRRARVRASSGKPKPKCDTKPLAPHLNPHPNKIDFDGRYEVRPDALPPNATAVERAAVVREVLAFLQAAAMEQQHGDSAVIPHILLITSQFY